MGTTASIIALTIVGVAAAAGIISYAIYEKNKKKNKNDNEKSNNRPNIQINDDSSSISSQENTKTNNIEISPLISKISDNNSISIEVGTKKIESNDHTSLPSKSKNNPFLHNYENEVIYGCNRKAYTIKQFLGSGSVGKVYSGINNETGEENVAIKIININKNTKIELLTENEIQIMLDFANLKNVVKLIDHGVINDDIYIIMEKCDKNLSNCKMIEEEIREMLIQFKPVFIHFNEKKLIHRDIKPENILIKFDENKKPIYKLTDFSISKYVDLTHSQCGTLGFMAPQMHDKDDYTNKADVYSLGATIYFLLFGTCPKLKEVYTKNFQFMPKDNDLKDLLLKMLTYNEIDRISWDDLIKHPFLNNNNINKIIGE